MMMFLIFATRSLLAAASIEAQAAMPTVDPQNAQSTLSINDVVPGSMGVCYTVFEGDEVEPFAFTVKSVMPRYLGPDDDLLLVRLMGEKPEFTGVVSGMSGSPCFIGNKLVGALSYSFTSFAKEPIAGITPIAAMNRTLQFPEVDRPYRLDTAHVAPPWPHTEDATGHRADTSDVSNHAPGRSFSYAAAASGGAAPMFMPIATPLGLGNMAPQVQKFFAPYLESMGFVPMATAVMGASDRLPTALKPGGAIAVILAQGDIQMAATGTVTTVAGNKVLAFGHPFTSGGPVSFPMATSRIVNTMASSMHSFKMAVAGPVVGEIHDDRLPAIAGTLGAGPAMIAVRGSLNSPPKKHTFSFEVARDPSLTPRIVAMGVVNALTSRTEAASRGIGRVRATFTVEDHEPVVATFVESHEQGGLIFMQPALHVAQYMATLWNTPFAPPKQVAVALEADYAPVPIDETVADITLDSAHIVNGGILKASVQLRDRTGHLRQENFRLPVPARWSGETLQMVATGGADAAHFLRELNGFANPLSYGDVLAELRRRPQQGELYLFVLREGVTLHRGGRNYGNVPATALALLGQAASDQLRDCSIDYQGQRHAQGAVTGLIKRSFFVAPKAQLQRGLSAAHP